MLAFLFLQMSDPALFRMLAADIAQGRQFGIFNAGLGVAGVAGKETRRRRGEQPAAPRAA